MPETSSATFLLIGDHSQDGTPPPRPAAPAVATSRGELDLERSSISLSGPAASVVYGPPPARPRA